MASIYKKHRIDLIQDQIEEHGFTFCEACKRSNAFKFEVHHLIFRSEAPNHENLHDKINLIILCSECHRDYHTDKALRIPLVQERGLKELFNINLLFVGD